MATRTPKTLAQYKALRYTIVLVPDPDGGYVAKIPDLPGCLSQGETPETALRNLDEARELWIETAHAHGDEIPLPKNEDPR